MRHNIGHSNPHDELKIISSIFFCLQVDGELKVIFIDSHWDLDKKATDLEKQEQKFNEYTEELWQVADSVEVRFFYETD